MLPKTAMVVRCDQCQSEYELDEARLHSNEATVKCTACGHLFRVRRRPRTSQGVAAPRSPSAPASPETTREVDYGTVSRERRWLLRLENGEVHACRDFDTLQQWIAARFVSPATEISRNGSTWKRLETIAELRPFFSAREPTVAMGTSGQSGTMLGFAAADGDTPVVPMQPVPSRHTSMPNVVARARGDVPAEDPLDMTVAMEDPVAGNLGVVSRDRTMGAIPEAPINFSNSTAQTVHAAPSGISGAPPRLLPRPGAGPSQGPVSGRVRATAQDPAFAGGRANQRGPSLFPANADPQHGEGFARPSRAGWWIAGVALVAIAGGVSAMWWMGRVPVTVVSNGLDAPRSQQAELGVAPPVTAPDAATSPPLPPALLADEWAPLGADLGAADKARIAASVASSVSAAASVAVGPDVGAWAARAKSRLMEAVPLAHTAANERSALGHIAMADVLRLMGKPKADVEAELSAAKPYLANAALQREWDLANALSTMTFGPPEDAQRQLLALDAGAGGPGAYEQTGDVRPRYYQIVVHIRAAQWSQANDKLRTLASLTARHEGIRLMLARVSLESAKAADPMPPEEAPAAGVGAVSTAPSGLKLPGSATTSAQAPAPIGAPKALDSPKATEPHDHDELVAAAKLLEGKRCADAIAYYERALDEEPSSTVALLGIARCQMRRGNYSSAHSKFRAVLAMDSSNEGALRGVAEALEKMGDKEAALEAWERFLRAYPSDAAAQRRAAALRAPAPLADPLPPETE